MNYNEIIGGTFLERPNRFIAIVDIEGLKEKVHVKNTGRCKELLVPGATVYLEKSNNPNRKTKYSLISVIKGERLINMDSQVPNEVVYDALLAGEIKAIGSVVKAKREVTYKDSRFDIYYEKADGTQGFIEVKGVTLEENGIGMFPDAPTKRGEKHIRGLMDAKVSGYETSVFFLVQMNDVIHFTPNKLRDPELNQAIIEAEELGVNILVYDSEVTSTSIELGTVLPYKLSQDSHMKDRK